MRALHTLLRRRAEECPDSTLEDAFLGLLHKRIMYALMKEAGLSPCPARFGRCVQKSWARLAELLKKLASAGGRPHGMGAGSGDRRRDSVAGDWRRFFQSRCRPGLYLAGEVLT